jgi:heme-degrading monooxygenase HmoA
MSVVKINAITIPLGMGPELESRFAARAGAVENQPGFEEFMLLRPTAGDDRYFVVTRWESEEAFQDWRHGQSFANAHGQGAPAAGGHPGGPQEGAAVGAEGVAAPRPPVGMSGELLEFDVVSLALPS